MNKTAQLGIFLGVIIAVIASLALYSAIVSQVGSITTTTIWNGSEQGSTTVADNATGTYTDLAGMEYISGFQVRNATDGTDVTSNFTISEGISATTSLKTVRVELNSQNQYGGVPVNISYTLGTDGYIADSGARAVAGLIAVFAALGIIVVMLVPTLRSEVLRLLGK